MIKVIGFAGKMHSGKSFAAKRCQDLLRSNGYCTGILHFAKAVKDIALDMGWNGVKDVKGRRLLQLIGTECGRECIDDNVWVDKWLNNYHRYIEVNPNLILLVDDVRFENELNCIKNLGGIVIYIKGKESWIKNLFAHKSEKLITKSMTDVVIDNRDKNENRLINSLELILKTRSLI